MKRSIISLSTALLVLSMVCGLAWGQATAQISGTVSDQTGAVLPGAEILATQTDTGVARMTISNETGSYVLPNLPLGPYRVEVALPGFRTFIQTGVVLQVNSSPVINARLEVGQVSEQVEVQANAAAVETRSVGVGQVIENQRILELPLNGRNVTDLITLGGAAVQVATATQRGFSPALPLISVAGGMGYGVAYQLDGAIHNNPYDGTSMPFPFPDSLQEFKTETSGLTAQNGRHSGASVNAVTKSGTNDIHGDLFEFVRNDLFNATSYFAAVGPDGKKVRSSLKRNQFGGTAGGPIMKNKLFFFGGYQGTTVRRDPADVRQVVPTAAILRGDWTAFTSPTCNAGRQLTLRAPFVNNTIDPSLYSPAALRIAARLPQANNPCGEIFFGQRAVQDDWQAVGRMDFQKSDKNSIFGRYMITGYTEDPPIKYDPNVLNAGVAGIDNLAQMFTIGNTYLVSSNVVQSFRLAANRIAVHRFGLPFFGYEDVGINMYSFVPHYMRLTVTGGFNLGSGSGGDTFVNTASFQGVDDLSIVRGNHQFALGANAAFGDSNLITRFFGVGNVPFTSQATGVGMGDFLLGKVTNFQQAGPNELHTNQWYIGVYGQDTWKVTPRVTLNYGVRWEPFLPQNFKDGRIYNFSEERFHAGIKSTVIPNAPAGFYYPGDPGFPGKTGANTQWGNMGPRLGLAWDVNGDGRTSVRASYALAYEYTPLTFHIDTTGFAAPFGNEVDQPSVSLDNPYATYPGGNPFPYVKPTYPFKNVNVFFPLYSSFTSIPFDLKNTYAQSWNISLQRELPGNIVAGASYAGLQMTHVWTLQALSPAIYLPQASCVLNGVPYTPCSSTANTNQRRKLSLERPQDGQYMSYMDKLDDGGTQSYHGLILTLDRRSVKGVAVGANYTWSHCYGDQTDSSGDGPNPGQGYTNPLNRDADRGNCVSDRRHVVNLTSVAQTPQFSNNTLRMIGSNWRVSGIYRWSSGQPLNILSGIDQALNGVQSQRGQQLLADPYSDKSGRPLTNFLNPAAFTQPALGTLGNIGRNNIAGPSTWQLDAALSRFFQFRESQRLEFRVDAFNLTNSFRANPPNSSVNNNLFGQIRTARDSRILQFALKYVF
jgi:carboxypeptidase family protein